MDLREHVRDSLERCGCDRGEQVLVAVSGGVDSMVLLHALRRIGQPCMAIHMDHGLRGEEGRQEGEVVAAFCKDLGVSFIGMEVDPGVFNDPIGGSMQMRARHARHTMLKKRAEEHGVRWIAMGHQADDLAETLLLNLIRGAGTRGWAGIPERSGPFIRPLLGQRRSSIETYARQEGIRFVEDPSNRSLKFDRNRIRHEVIPILGAIRPGAVDAILHSLDQLKPILEHWHRLVDNVLREAPPDALPFALIEGDLPALPVLHQVLRPMGFHPRTIQAVDRAISQRRIGACFRSGKHAVWVDREALLIRSSEDPSPIEPVLIDHGLRVPEHAPIRVERGRAPLDASGQPGAAVWLDPSRLTFPLMWRSWNRGDRMRPAGLNGSKLISDLLIEAKVPNPDKHHYGVLCSGDRIIWLPGIRLAEGVAAPPGMEHAIRVQWYPVPVGPIGDRLSSASNTLPS